MTDVILSKLQLYLTKDKFGSSEWEKRGLNPSSSDIRNLMADGVNNCCKNLIEIQKTTNPRIGYKKIFKNGLTAIEKRDLDTEEKEFICDCFEELASIVSININNELNRWLYGSFLNGLLKITKVLKGSSQPRKGI